MKIFQGKQADSIEAKVEQLEVVLGLAHGKGQIEDRLSLIVSAAIARSKGYDLCREELKSWKDPAMNAAESIARLIELSASTATSEGENRRRNWRRRVGK